MRFEFGSVSGAALAVCLMASGVAAQDAADGDILVTSTKDAATELQGFPGGITIVDNDALEARSFNDLSNLSHISPNVTLDPIGTFKGVANFSIRGLGINSSIPSIDPAAGLFVDGVYMGINAGTVFDMLDVEQVDILRGPQGVSFGRNTTGGAIMVRTADPSEEWEGNARLSTEGPVDGGRGGTMWSARGIVSGPIAQDISIRLGALYVDDQGYFKNQFDGQNFGGGETVIVRGGFAYRSEGVTLIAKGEYSDANGDGAPTHNNGLFGRDNFAISVNQRGFHDSENGFVSLRGEVELGRGTITNIFGWRKYDLATRNDIDSTPTPIFESDTATAQEQFSNELTYAVDLDGVRLVTGVFALTQDVSYDESRDLSFFGAAPQFGGGRQDHDALGLFGQVDVPFTDALSLKAGLRFSHEEKTGAITYVRPRAQCSVIGGTCPTSGERVAGENNGFTDKRSWSSFSPRLVLSYDLSADTLVFASWARGHRSGGYNLRITQPAAFEEVSALLGSPAFDEERVDTFELGTNWQSADGRANLRAAAFWSEVDDLQRELNVPSDAGLAQSVYNTGDARILGGELEASVIAAPGFTLAAHVGLTDAQYRDVFFDLTGDGIVTAEDAALELPRAPKWTYGASADWQTPLSATKTLSANINFQHRDRAAYTDNNVGFNDAVDRLDAALAVSCNTCGVTVRVFGRNLLDEVQFGGDTQLPFGGGPFSDGDNTPFDPAPASGTFSPLHKGRTVGLEVLAQF